MRARTNSNVHSERKHAIVIGASMAGLVTARVLSAHFERVTVFDRDVLPDEFEPRNGVPQGRHGHGVLASGFRALNALFPGLEPELVAAGAVPGDVVGNLRWYQHGYYKAKFQSGLAGAVLSRPLLEGVVRRRVQALPNVRIVDKCHVTALVADPDRRRVIGVRIRQPGETPVAYTADLVVDASGRSSRSPEWLAELGYDPPAIEEVTILHGYTTRTFRRRPGDLDGDVGAIIGPKPPRLRAGFMLAMEGDRWMVTVGGWMGDHAAPDPEAYLEFARSLERPDIYDVIKRAEPLTELVSYKFPSNLRRRYERLRRFPTHYLVIGDAVCSFNPFYGQGMSVAAEEALALEACLTRARAIEDLPRPFFKAASRLIDAPWTIAAGSDFAFPGVTGPRPPANGLINWYLDRVHRVASVDQSVCGTFFEVANLVRPTSALFNPRLVARVIKGCLWPQPARVPLGTERSGHTSTGMMPSA
jgi:2-polyprenyl-6-methoxyphenol hydroxylase-like FAD-dependent oxidoreductase